MRTLILLLLGVGWATSSSGQSHDGSSSALAGLVPVPVCTSPCYADGNGVPGGHDPDRVRPGWPSQDDRAWGLSFSFHLGYGFPLGDFADSHDPGPSVTGDVEYRFARNVSAVAFLGYHAFPSNTADAAGLTNLSLNLRAYAPAGPWQVFAQLGPGIYWPNPGGSELGGNVGVGLSFPIHPKLSLEVGPNLHGVSADGDTRLFIDTMLGISWRY